ncbi:MAG: CBS domain-containing protein [Planctomycetes bacterium]|nr:CBS domain-containing protein [Planctomycetota bacterium]MBL7146385.1 CBS domain-containing protein [Phycisphaerae bacterium]
MTKEQSKLIDIIDDMCETKDILFHMMRSVKDIMTYNVKTLTLDDTIETCLEIMTENKIRHVPIVENAAEEGEPFFVGIVSQRDIFRQISPCMGKKGHVDSDSKALKQLLVQIVTRKPKCASPETPIQDATSLMVENRVDSVPVLFENELVGIVTATDVLKLFARLHAIGQLCGDKAQTGPRRRFVDLLAGNSDKAIWALSSVLGTVKDIMTEQVVSLEEQDDVDKVMKVMQKGKFRHVPVVDRQKRLVGIISDRDILRLLPYRKGQRKPQSDVFRADLFDVEPHEPAIRRQVYRIMNQNVIHVRPDCGFYDVVKMLHEMKISCVPVIDEDKNLLGIATVTDVMRGLLAAYALFEKNSA